MSRQTQSVQGPIGIPTPPHSRASTPSVSFSNNVTVIPAPVYPPAQVSFSDNVTVIPAPVYPPAQVSFSDNVTVIPAAVYLPETVDFNDPMFDNSAAPNPIDLDDTAEIVTGLPISEEVSFDDEFTVIQHVSFADDEDDDRDWHVDDWHVNMPFFTNESDYDDFEVDISYPSASNDKRVSFADADEIIPAAAYSTKVSFASTDEVIPPAAHPTKKVSFASTADEIIPAPIRPIKHVTIAPDVTYAEPPIYPPKRVTWSDAAHLIAAPVRAVCAIQSIARSDDNAIAGPFVTATTCATPYQQPRGLKSILVAAGTRDFEIREGDGNGYGYGERLGWDSKY